jgi:hypothetical protein
MDTAHTQHQGQPTWALPMLSVGATELNTQTEMPRAAHVADWNDKVERVSNKRTSARAWYDPQHEGNNRSTRHQAIQIVQARPLARPSKNPPRTKSKPLMPPIHQEDCDSPDERKRTSPLKCSLPYLNELHLHVWYGHCRQWKPEQQQHYVQASYAHDSADNGQ